LFFGCGVSAFAFDGQQGFDGFDVVPVLNLRAALAQMRVGDAEVYAPFLRFLAFPFFLTANFIA
jgi:hypothetical protein